MNKYVAIIAIAAVAVFAIVASSGAQAPGPQTLVLKEQSKGSKFTFVDAARPFSKKRPSMGDYFVFTSPVSDAAGARQGELEVQCTITKASKKVSQEVDLCQGVVNLKTGDIFLSARVKGEGTNVTGAVTGGTGAYANARGTFTSIGDPATDTLTFTTS